MKCTFPFKLSVGETEAEFTPTLAHNTHSVSSTIIGTLSIGVWANLAIKKIFIVYPLDLSSKMFTKIEPLIKLQQSKEKNPINT